VVARRVCRKVGMQILLRMQDLGREREQEQVRIIVRIIASYGSCSVCEK